MADHRVTTRAEIPTRATVEDIRTFVERYDLGSVKEDILTILARLDEAERLLREVEEAMWDEEPLCSEIRAFLGDEGTESRPPNGALEIAMAGRWWQVREVWPSGHAQVLQSYPTQDRAEPALADLEEEWQWSGDAPL